MAIRVLDRAVPARPDQLHRAEQELGRALPHEFADFLRAGNGGRPEPNHSTLPAAQPLGVGVTAFYGLDRSPADTDLLARRRALHGRVPADLLAVADAEGGNLVAVSLRPSDLGTVWYWDHEWEAEDGRDAAWDNVTPIAPGFAAFLASLEPQPPAEPTAVREAWIHPDLLAEFRGPP